MKSGWLFVETAHMKLKCDELLIFAFSILIFLTIKLANGLVSSKPALNSCIILDVERTRQSILIIEIPDVLQPNFMMRLASAQFILWKIIRIAMYDITKEPILHVITCFYVFTTNIESENKPKRMTEKQKHQQSSLSLVRDRLMT